MNTLTYTVTDEISTALSFVPAHERETWIRMGMAVKAELGEGGFSIWDSWSQSAESYQPKAALQAWKSFKANGKVTIASLFHEAMKHGWQPQQVSKPINAEQRAALEAEKLAAQNEAARIQGEGYAAAKQKAVKLWEKAHTPLPNHPYLSTKQITAHGAKQLKDMLLLPLRLNGELINLQLIMADGSKRFLTGGQVKESSVVLGQLKGANEVLLCEGWATGCTLYEITKLPVVVAINASNLPVIASRLADALPKAALRICADNDPTGTGEKAAKRAITNHHLATWCMPTFTEEEIARHLQHQSKAPSDFNDLFQLAGADAVKAQLLRVQLDQEMASIPEPENLIKPDTSAPENLIKPDTLETEKLIKPATSGADTNPTGTPESAGTAQENPIEYSNLETSEATKNQTIELGTLENSFKITDVKKSQYFVCDNTPLVRPGVYWQPPTEDDKEPASPIWLCSPLYVQAETRDIQGSNWGRLLSWKDNDQKTHHWACPMELLAASDTCDFRKEMVRNGLTISSEQKARQKLADYVQNHPPLQPARLRCVGKVGWLEDRYVLPHRAYGDQAGEGVIYQGFDVGDFHQSGTLHDWQQQIAAMAIGNSRITLSISIAFTGVLCKIAGESGGGFHFEGSTSKGKSSTLLDPAASVWGHPDSFSKKWRATCNGLEGLCLARNDGLLILDELAQVPAAEAGNAAYLIANGQAKARMSKEGSSRPLATWRVMLLSAGEIDLTQHMAEAGKTAKGGQVARLPAIPADAGAGLGTIEQLHHHANGQSFADHMKANTRKYYGTAGIAFLERLTRSEELANVIQKIKPAIAAISASFQLPANCAPEIHRVAFRFALVAYTGELATKYGVTGWQAGESIKAVTQCFNVWLETKGSGLTSDDRALLAQVASLLQSHGSTRFPPHDADPDTLARYPNRAGFSCTDPDGNMQFLVFPEPFRKDFCKGHNSTHAAQVLLNHGFLLPGDTENKDGKQTRRKTSKKRVPAMGNKPMSFYILTSAALGGDHE